MVHDFRESDIGPCLCQLKDLITNRLKRTARRTRPHLSTRCGRCADNAPPIGLPSLSQHRTALLRPDGTFHLQRHQSNTCVSQSTEIDQPQGLMEARASAAAGRKESCTTSSLVHGAAIERLGNRDQESMSYFSLAENCPRNALQVYT